MKVAHLSQVSRFKNPSFLLLCIATGLITIHVTLAWRSDDADFLGISLLFWFAVSQLIWQRRDRLNLESSLISALAGLGILGLVLLKSTSTYGYDFFLRLFPVAAAFGLGLLASGLKDLKQYWQELLALGFLAIPPNLISQSFDISILTAKLSAFMLWYSASDVVRDGVDIHLPGGSVEVYPGCSGMVQIFYLLGLAVLVLMMFQLQGRVKQISLFLVAVLIGFVVNGIRVAIMARLVAAGNDAAFHYWHVGTGSNIFSMISVLIFTFFCWYLLRPDEPPLPLDGTTDGI